MNEFRVFVSERVTPEDVHKSGAWIVYMKNEDAPGTYPDPLAPNLPSLVYVINFKNLQEALCVQENFSQKTYLKKHFKTCSCPRTWRG